MPGLPPFEPPAGRGTPQPFFQARLEEDLVRRESALASAARRTRRRADSEAIHDLRVAVRRALAGLDLWMALLRPRPARRARRSLARLRRALAPARDLEADLARLAEGLADAPAETRIATEVLRVRLERRLARRARRAAEAASGGRMVRLLRRLARSRRDLARPCDPALDPTASARFRIESALRNAGAAAQNALGAPDDAPLHRARVAVKKARYLVEGLEEVAPVASFERVRALEALREVQRALGVAHDRAVLRERVDRHARRISAHGRSAEARALTPLLVALERERLAAVERFRELAPALGRPGPDREAGRPA